MPWTVVPESQYEKSRLFRNEFGRYAVRAFTRTDYYYAFIDESAYPIVRGYRWYAAQHGKTGNMLLAVTERASKQIYMQWLIYNIYIAQYVDAVRSYISHKDGDKLNNELSNLQATTRGIPDRQRKAEDRTMLHVSDSQERR